ncbi:hypothetical protein H257_04039 [Aphanomyces astaci]|uniref:Thioredoxin domain-containing protein n=1 Tax=Aphanomyces astaci TaxID=112090 RepID=W4GW72_APHAT|nr:hypothetical protein H257_04039 [Aphanomyces astaci]ETV83274.1 hypothetical protein H257_04039 [Aphanomyces astaci]KAF0751177.1 hypothetical protein AaE_006478 [Aphanomyces astaci]|eukprot:XP_009826704.1 hypothetical protein H257_04039 [Aphanomyces astaci]
MSLAVPIKDLDQWTHVKETNADKLIVVDVYQDWCGPCRVLEPTYKRISTETPGGDSRVLFASVSATLKIENIADNQCCKPRFVLYRDKKIVSDIVGVNVPTLEAAVKQNLPARKSDDDGDP